MARIRRIYACAAALTSAAALAPAPRELHRRQALSSGAAAALALVAAPASPAFAVDASAAIAVERSGFAPTIKQTGRTSRYECGRGVRRGAFINRRDDCVLVRHRQSRSRRDTILGPRGSKSTVQIAFDYPSTWTAFKNSVDVIDGNTGTVATVVAAPAGDLDSKAFYNCIFSPNGKIQRAGTPIDEYKVLSVRDGVLPGYKEVALKFTAVSPNSRLIDRRAVATATQIGDTAYIFIVSAAAVKWKDEQDRVTAAARTFTAM